MNETKRIFFIAFEFPPLGGAGVQRSLKFVKYLPEFNIQPIVITIREEDYHTLMPGHPKDLTLLNEISDNTIIERIPCKSIQPNTSRFSKHISQFLRVVEQFSTLWEEDLKNRLPALLEKYKPSAIYISLPPFAMAPLWNRVLRNSGIPVILDFRDAWTQWCIEPNQTYFHYIFKKSIEGEALKWASRVITSTDQIRKDFLRVHPGVKPEKFSVITNGFDGSLNISDQLKVNKEGKIIIGYVGSFYYTPESRERIFTPRIKRPVHRMLHFVPRKEDWLYRSPWFFFGALRQFLDLNPEYSERIEVRFAGRTPDWLKDQISNFRLENICRHSGYLNHDCIIKFQNECDLLLITSSKVLGGRDYSIAGKTFEYFMIGKPILGFVCEGEQKDILEESGMAVICDPDNPHESVQKLKDLFKGSTILKPDVNRMSKYHRRYLSEKLSEVINSVVTESGN